MFDCGVEICLCPIPQKSIKNQLLKILSEVLNNFVSILFLKKIFVLKAAFYRNSISHFKHL